MWAAVAGRTVDGVALVASIYHGLAMRAVRGEVALRLAVPCDIRPLIGECLRGGPLLYPATNPGPGRSEIPGGISGVGPFVEAIRRLGASVTGT